MAARRSSESYSLACDGSAVSEAGWVKGGRGVLLFNRFSRWAVDEANASNQRIESTNRIVKAKR